MGMKSKFKQFFELEDDYQNQDSNQEEVSSQQEQVGSPTRSKSTKTQNVVSLQSIQQSAKVILCEPRKYDEAQEIADHLKNRKAIVVNLQRMATEQALRVIDFLSGTVYAIGGDIQKLGPNIFLCTPDNMDVSGSISEMFQERYDM
jgi:cell division inhibitor SepF